jgi:sulfite exporter TauE/SafE
MSGEFGYALAFLTGLLGAGHCLGMCSGLAAGPALYRGTWWRPGPLLAYHGGRIAVYVVLGTLGATLGRTLVQTGALGKVQGLLMVLAGLVIIGLGLRLTGLLPWFAPRRCGGAAPCVPAPVRVTPWRARLAPLLAGLGNGLVPCSLVFSVATRATAGADPLQAAGLMLSFGLGTLPMMGTVTALGGLVGHKARGLTLRLAGGVVVLLGAWTLYEGLVFYQVMSGLAN